MLRLPRINSSLPRINSSLPHVYRGGAALALLRRFFRGGRRHVVDGSLDLSEVDFAAEDLPGLPDDLHVKGSLTLTLATITALPKKLRVDGTLNLTSTQIQALPPDLEVGGSIHALASQWLREIPGSVKVGGSILL